MRAPGHFSREDLIRQLQALGVRRGEVLIVHTAFSKVGPVEGGPEGLIDALQSAVGPAGTLMMPSMADADDEPFRPEASPCLGMGVVADTFWRLPGVLRSDSPHAFAARGSLAPELTQPHPMDIPHGPDSPVGRAYEHDAGVLLLGVGHDANTTIHLAENLAGVRYRKRYHATVVTNGLPTRLDFSEVDHCCQNFSLLDDWLDAEGTQRRGPVARATARLARSRDIVRVPTARLEAFETVFLHPPGICEECDEARASITEDEPQ